MKSFYDKDIENIMKRIQNNKQKACYKLQFGDKDKEAYQDKINAEKLLKKHKKIAGYISQYNILKYQ